MKKIILTICASLIFTTVYAQDKKEGPDYTILNDHLRKEDVTTHGVTGPNKRQKLSPLLKWLEKNRELYIELIQSYNKCSPEMVSEIITKLKKASDIYEGWPADTYYKVQRDVEDYKGCTIPSVNVEAARAVYKFGWLKYCIGILNIMNPGDEDKFLDEVLGTEHAYSAQSRDSLRSLIRAHRSGAMESSILFAYDRLMTAGDVEEALDIIGYPGPIETAGVDNIFDLALKDYRIDAELAHWLSEELGAHEPIVEGKPSPSINDYEKFFSKWNHIMIMHKVVPGDYSYVIFSTTKGWPMSREFITEAFSELINDYKPDQVKLDNTELVIFYRREIK